MGIKSIYARVKSVPLVYVVTALLCINLAFTIIMYIKLLDVDYSVSSIWEEAFAAKDINDIVDATKEAAEDARDAAYRAETAAEHASDAADDAKTAAEGAERAASSTEAMCATCD